MTEPLTNEIRLFGPPGTGKTTRLASNIHSTAKDRGTDRIVVGSFTRTAAAEIAGRGLPIPEQQVGTLHSLAYRAIDRPDVAVDKIASWNTAHRDLAMSGDTRNLDEGAVDTAAAGGTLEGDAMLGRLETLRARLVPPEAWPANLKVFARLWTEWKDEHEVVDYTDMIEIALEQAERAPGNPLVGFFDEFQDFTPLEIALVRKWGAHMDRLIIAGDDDQTLYSFKGATPKAFLQPEIPDEQKRFLTQSYRVPRAVQVTAQRWIEMVTEREEKRYDPRDVEGVVRFGSRFGYAQPEALVLDAVAQVDAGRTVMILSSCAYMLDPIRGMLRKAGVPFHNPYRRTRGDWNPLGGGRGTSAAERLAAYLIIDPDRFPDDYRQWTGADLKAWVHVIKVTGVLARGAKKLIDGLDNDATVPYEFLEQFFADDDVFGAALEASPDWFRDRLLAGKRASMEYPLLIAKHRPGADLITPPRLIVGTIHSVKGGEADVVYLLPDLSKAGAREFKQSAGEARDAVIRQMYVGMTRAAEELVVCACSSIDAVDPQLIMRCADRPREMA